MDKTEKKSAKLEIIVITGLSGSGKSTAIAALEDDGFFTVDNLPVALLPKFLEIPIQKDSEMVGLAFVMDVREKGFIEQYKSIFSNLKKKGYQFKVIFLEAEKEYLVKRYSQTRRHHPLSKGKSLLEGIDLEILKLKSIRQYANFIIDTTHYNVHELKVQILKLVRSTGNKAMMDFNVTSFGFKHGIPYYADLIIDVRFIANPYFHSDLKPLDGKSEAVQNYVINQEITGIFLSKYLDLIDFLIPLYEKEGKAYLTLAIGCTGGRHRSVAIAEYIYKHLAKKYKNGQISHRDIDRTE